MNAVTDHVHLTQTPWEAVDEIQWNSILGGLLSPLSSMSPTSEHLGFGPTDDPIVPNESEGSEASRERWGTDNPVWDTEGDDTEMDVGVLTWWGTNKGMHPQVPDF